MSNNMSGTDQTEYSPGLYDERSLFDSEYFLQGSDGEPTVDVYPVNDRQYVYHRQTRPGMNPVSMSSANEHVTFTPSRPRVNWISTPGDSIEYSPPNNLAGFERVMNNLTAAIDILDHVVQLAFEELPPHPDREANLRRLVNLYDLAQLTHASMSGEVNEGFLGLGPLNRNTTNTSMQKRNYAMAMPACSQCQMPSSQAMGHLFPNQNQRNDFNSSNQMSINQAAQAPLGQEYRYNQMANPIRSGVEAGLTLRMGDEYPNRSVVNQLRFTAPQRFHSARQAPFGISLSFRSPSESHPLAPVPPPALIPAQPESYLEPHRVYSSLLMQPDQDINIYDPRPRSPLPITTDNNCTPYLVRSRLNVNLTITDTDTDIEDSDSININISIATNDNSNNNSQSTLQR